MLTIQWEDVLAVLNSVRTQLIVICVALVAAIALSIIFRKKRVPAKGKRRLIRASAWSAALIAIVASLNTAITGPLNSMVSMALGDTPQLAADTIDATNELAVSIEKEGITLLKNEDSVLPLTAGNVNLFGWAYTNPIYGGTGSGSLSADYPTISLVQGLENAGFTVNSELTSFYTDLNP